MRRILRSRRKVWAYTFAESGREALELLSGKEQFDLIVSDMHMPGMDGAQLLEEVRKRHPHMVRLILSGQSEQEAVMASVKPAHQFLAKPIDPETLIAVLERALALKDVLADESLARILSDVESLPTLPEAYSRLIKAIEADNCSLEAIGKIIEQDMGMTATILKVVNSAFFGIPRRIEKPAQAVSLLGLDVIRALVLSYQLFSSFDLSRSKTFSFERLWQHSLAAGGLAKVISQEEGLDQAQADNAFFAGLLHDVGKLPLIAFATDEYARILERAQKEERLLWEVEMETLGTSHAEAGAFLMGLWGLREPVISAIAFHHQPSRLPEKKFSPLSAVHAADVLEHELGSHLKTHVCPQWDTEYLSRLGLQDRVPVWSEICKVNLNRGVENE